MYKIREEILNQILNYLAKKPFIEVHGLIAELQKAELIKEEEEKGE